MPRHFRLKLLAAAISLAAVTSISATTASNNLVNGSAFVAVAQHATTLHPGDMVVGPLAVTQPMHVAISLKLRNKAQLDAFIAQPHHANLTSAQFNALYSPTQADAQAVANYLKASGFSNVVIEPNRQLVTATGRADTAATAFRTSFVRVRTHDGRDAYATGSAVSIPASLQNQVLEVLGLENLHKFHVLTPIQVNAAGGTEAGHSPTDFAKIYNASSTATGKTVSVGVITEGSMTKVKSDFSSFLSQNSSLGSIPVNVVTVDSGSSDTAGDGEWDLDTQDIAGMSGGVKAFYLYDTSSLDTQPLIDDFNRAVTDNVVQIVNVSIGGCETGSSTNGVATGDNIFEQAVAQGQTFSISTGDSGADECGTGGIVPSWPADSQYVVAVGGTTLFTSGTTWTNETVWNDLSSSEGATGGSPSTFEAQPSWQQNVGKNSGSQYRGLPDVAFDASPNSGANVIVDGASQQIGGTSLASPLFVGMWARALATKSSLGFAAPVIYADAKTHYATDFHDVTSGNNSGETAAVGWDYTTGFGSINVANFIANVAGGSTPPPAGAPVANFGDTTSGLTVTFTDNSTDTGATITSQSWNFGDGNTSTAANVSHTYAAAGTYSVSLTVTDSTGATNTKTQSVTVTAAGGGGGGGGNVLQNGVALTGQAAATNAQLAYTVVIPAGATNLVISESGGTGDADLYTRFGSAPTLSTYDCRPYITGNNESCSVAAPQAGTYYVLLNGYAAFSGVSVKATWTVGSGGGGGGGGNVLQNGTPVTGLHATKNNSVTYTMVVPAGASNLNFAIAGGTGDADLYVKFGAAPTTSSYDCRPYLTGNSESCASATPQAGTYYVTVRAYASYTGVQLTGTYTP